MSTKIEWTDKTWNAVTGCDHVSPGCDNCYAERIATRFGRPFIGAVECHDDRLSLPMRWRKPRRVFVNSVSDLFHPDVPDDFIVEMLAVMALCRRHSFQVLTKRPQRMAKFMSDPGLHGDIGIAATERFVRIGSHDAWRFSTEDWTVRSSRGVNTWFPPWPLPNVWLGVSVENQRFADLRIPHLLSTPAAIRFLSVEPLLGPVDVAAGLFGLARLPGDQPRGIDWVIVGGESGPGARPMHPLWASAIRRQCKDAGVPFFFKQQGEWASYTHGNVHSDELTRGRKELVIDLAGTILEPDDPCEPEREPSLMLRVGKSRAGRLLDGREWNEYPS